jgi:integrase
MKRPRKSGRPAGRYPGQMRPFSVEQVARLEGLFRADGGRTAARDRALLRVGIDSCLRSADVLRITLRDVAPNGEIASGFRIRQKKTGKWQPCELLPKSIDALKAWLELNPDMQPDDRVFAICTRQHYRIVKQWCGKLGLDPSLYATHSVRRTRPAHLYKHTHNIVAMQRLLGHENPANTAKYLAVENDDALELARKFPI